jgi:hypothetical protein
MEEGATMYRKAVGFLGLLVLSAAVDLQAASDAGFPEGWNTWPVTKTGRIPGNQTPIPADLPAIVQATIKTYNWVQDGKGSAYNVRVNPEQRATHTEGKGKYADKPTAVLELTDIKALLVTEHLLGKPLYGVYTYDGKDISDAHPSLKTSTCVACHSGYGEACIAGVCSK